MNELAFDPMYLIGEFTLIALIVVLVIIDVFKKPIFAVLNDPKRAEELDSRNRQVSWITGIGLAVVALLYFVYGRMFSGESVIFLHNSIKAGGGVYIGKIALIAAGLCTVLMSARYTQAQAIPGIDYYLLLCFSLLGAVTLIATENFLMLFLALEMMSIPVYALVGLKHFDSRAGESAIKYLLLGGFSSAFLLLGISLLYGVSGSLVIQDVISSLSFQSITFSNPQSLLSAVGMILVFVGLAFKVSLVPFHAWTPDVYEGAATPVTAFMSVAVKLAAFSVILKLFANVTSFGVFDSALSGVFGFFALITIIYGNSVAIVQKNVKRMLAYSSIAHAGYMALALAPMHHTIEAQQAVLFYGIGYIAMNMMAFGVLVYLTHKGNYCENISDLRGIANKYPGAAAMMAIAMFSLGGLPPAVGFVGKLLVFMQLIKGKMYLTAVIALIFSLVALYFYINIIVQMYMRDREDAVKDVGKTALAPLWISLAATALFVLISGILPSPLMRWAMAWAETLF